MFNYWYASNEYVLLHISFWHSLHFFFLFFIFFNADVFLQSICKSICKHTTKNWIGVKGNNEGQPKIGHILKLMLGADKFGQSSILFGISLIINLKSFYKHQFHCFFLFFLFLFRMRNVWVDLIWRRNCSLEKAWAS